ncbi:NYN domain-containing protein, partial [Intestinimonas aquisgranensis]
MPQQNDQSLRLAVLIDADNASRTAMRDVMAEIAVYGTPTVKRIYGDWTTPNMASWKPILLENAITPIQQYSYTTGKNATDSAMIIDAMDILYTGSCDGFVLVSSDSDFTRLATRLREAGKKVIGMGEKKTPNPFIVACDKFIYIEVIRAEAKAALATAEQEAAAQAAESASASGKTEPAPAKAEGAKSGKKSRKKAAEPAAAPLP